VGFARGFFRSDLLVTASNTHRLSGLLEHTPWMELSQAEAEGKRIEALDLIKYVGSRRKVVLLDIKRTLEGGFSARLGCHFLRY